MGKFKPKKYYSKEKFISQIKKILREGKMTQDEFNEKIEVNQAVTRWKSGKTPSADSLLAIKNAFGVSIDLLLTGKELEPAHPPQPIIIVAGTLAEIPPETLTEPYLGVPLVSGLIGAGHEGAIPWEHTERLIYIHQQELGKRQHHNLRAIQVAKRANSMAPTIRPGDLVVIDPTERPPEVPLNKKAIYAVNLDEFGNAALKRVREVENYWICLSDNLDYNPILIKKSDMPNLIIGRVIWSWTSWVR